MSVIKLAHGSHCGSSETVQDVILGKSGHLSFRKTTWPKRVARSRLSIEKKFYTKSGFGLRPSSGVIWSKESVGKTLEKTMP